MILAILFKSVGLSVSILAIKFVNAINKPEVNEHLSSRYHDYSVYSNHAENLSQNGKHAAKSKARMSVVMNKDIFTYTTQTHKK